MEYANFSTLRTYRLPSEITEDNGQYKTYRQWGGSDTEWYKGHNSVMCSQCDIMDPVSGDSNSWSGDYIPFSKGTS